MLKDEVSFYIDCVKVQSVKLGISMDIVSEYINNISVGDKTSDGTTLTGICMKSGNSQQAEMVPVDLQSGFLRLLSSVCLNLNFLNRTLEASSFQ